MSEIKDGEGTLKMQDKVSIVLRHMLMEAVREGTHNECASAITSFAAQLIGALAHNQIEEALTDVGKIARETRHKLDAARHSAKAN